MWESQAAFLPDFSKRLREATLFVAFRERGISTAGLATLRLVLWSLTGQRGADCRGQQFSLQSLKLSFQLRRVQQAITFAQLLLGLRFDETRVQ